MSSIDAPRGLQDTQLHGIDMTQDDPPEFTPAQVEAVELALRPLAERALERALDEWSLALRQASPETAQAEQALLEEMYDQCGEPETNAAMYTAAEVVDHRRKIMVERNKADWRRKRGRKR